MSALPRQPRVKKEMIPHNSRLRIAAVTTIGILGALGLVALATFGQNESPSSIPFYTDTRRHQPVTCPAKATVIVAFGQSLSANSAEHVYLGAPNEGLYLYFAGRCYTLTDPLLGATGTAGSVWIPAASRLAALTSIPVVVIAGGVNGSAIARWTVPGSRLASPLRARIDEAKRSGLLPGIFAWIQGEADAEGRTSSDAYRADLGRLHALFNDAPWLITSNSICTNTPTRSSVLDQARRDFARVTPGITVAVDLDSLGTEYRSLDRCHFNQRGQNQAGAMIAEATASIIRNNRPSRRRNCRTRSRSRQSVKNRSFRPAARSGA